VGNKSERSRVERTEETAEAEALSCVVVRCPNLGTHVREKLPF